MNYKKWLLKNTENLRGKRIAVTGATGGIGIHLCEYLALLGADLILLNRDLSKSEALITDLKNKYSDINIKFIELKLDNINSVKLAVEKLKFEMPDIIIHNAGAYSIPRYKTELGIDNVFQINCIAPLYITQELMSTLSAKGGRVVFVGSIAHNYSKTNVENFDFSKYSAASKVYGNAKRCLMLTAYELFKNEKNVSYSVTHPGITFTNITNHYPKLIFAIIKNPMKIIFMRPKKAALSVLKGVFEDCGYGEWIGPRIFDVWGLPRKKYLKTFTESEAESVYDNALKILQKI